MICTVRNRALASCGRAVVFPLLVFVSTAVFAQSSKTSDDTPVFKTSTRAVIVDVVVDDGKGQPVSALRREDFRIFEDGKPQTIDFFE